MSKEFKNCSTCNKDKPLKEYYKHKNNPDGLSYSCKECVKRKSRKRNFRNLKERTNKNISTFRDKLNQAKFCTKCGEYKSFDEFNKGNGKYNLRSDCSVCHQKYKKLQRDLEKFANLEIEWIDDELIIEGHNGRVCTSCNDLKPFDKFYHHEGQKYNKNPNCIQCQKKWKKNNRDLVNKLQRRWYEENKERVNKKRRKRYENDEEYRKRVLEENKKWTEENVEKINEYFRKRKENDPQFRVTCNLRTRVHQATKKEVKSDTTLNLLGLNEWGEYYNYLERQFEEGMTWENYGEWHVDHIVPCAMFDMSKDYHQEECFFYTNLQPLWAEDNLKKGCKYE